ncbi:MAG: hypothetical protein L0I67_08255, partial [Enterobacterales bacterium]|nr:hypothetical protein [Enterobacterales bacterium]
SFFSLLPALRIILVFIYLRTLITLHIYLFEIKIIIQRPKTPTQFKFNDFNCEIFVYLSIKFNQLKPTIILSSLSLFATLQAHVKDCPDAQ